MITYELMQKGPAAYIPVVLVSLIMTLFAYGAFPLVYSRVRNKTITKKKYCLLCYSLNFFVMILFSTVSSGYHSSGPFILWTWIFSASGIRTLKSRGVLEGYQAFDSTKTTSNAGSDDYEVSETKVPEETITAYKEASVQEEKPQIRFCRKCGFELLPGSAFCSHCGTKIGEEIQQ